MGAPEILDPQDFIKAYGFDAPVVLGEPGRAMSLGQALQFEAMFCTADASDRRDPAKRVGYLARILADGGSLREEDEHLITRPE
ncbi:MAG: hypothetical protein ACREGA_03095 [Candidatus Saccharimonadales bacterium]